MQSMECVPLLPALAKTQNADREIKRKAFSAFCLSCSGNPRNLEARMCTGRSGVLQAAAVFASSSSSSFFLPEAKRENATSSAPFKKGMMKWSTTWLCHCRAAPQQAQLLKASPANGGLRDSVSAMLGLRFLAWVRRDPSLFKAVSCCIILSHFILSAVPRLAMLQTVICRSVLPPVPQVITEPLVLVWGGTLYNPQYLPSRSLA